MQGGVDLDLRERCSERDLNTSIRKSSTARESRILTFFKGEDGGVDEKESCSFFGCK